MASGLAARGQTESLLLVVNDFHEDAHFTLPTLAAATWKLLLDSCDVDAAEAGETYLVKAQSLALFVKEITQAE